ncbi:MAG: hypothetical protein WB609_06770 [Candidatus Cybelea sp.]
MRSRRRKAAPQDPREPSEIVELAPIETFVPLIDRTITREAFEQPPLGERGQSARPAVRSLRGDRTRAEVTVRATSPQTAGNAPALRAPVVVPLLPKPAVADETIPSEPPVRSEPRRRPIAANPNEAVRIDRGPSASPRAARERRTDDIQIHIGRIEVVAVPPASPRPIAVPARKSLSLDEYLQRRGGRSR